MPAFFGGALSLGFFVLRQKTQGGGVRTLPVFLDFLILFLGGDARHFFFGWGHTKNWWWTVVADSLGGIALSGDD